MIKNVKIYITEGDLELLENVKNTLETELAFIENPYVEDYIRDLENIIEDFSNALDEQ